jgi:acetyltransferase-like isoleucine patch superfamily enzyme
MLWKILKLFSRLFLILPAALFNILWRLLDIFDGRLGAVLRYGLVAARFRRCGRKVYIGPFVCIDDMDKIEIGDNVSIHRHCVILAAGGVRIGNDVSIAHSSSIVSSEHTWADADNSIKFNPIYLNGVSIHDDVWIGCGVRILSGTVINNRCVVAAGAVVKRICESRGVYGGVPARLLRNI